MAGAFRAAVNRAIPWLLFGSVMIPAVGSAIAGVLVLVFWRQGGDIALGVLVILFGLSVLAGTIISLALLLRQNRLARMQADFVARVSHELRTPMASIRMGVETLREGRFSSDDERHKFIEMIDRESARLAGLVEQTLGIKDLADATRMTPQSWPVAGLLGDAVDPFLTRPDTRDRVVVSVDADCDSVATVVDRESFISAVTNLIVNGLTHGKATAQEPISVSLRSEGRFVSIQVADHGPGIDSREIKKVFDRFSRGRKSAAAGIPGLGLGLALVREFAISCGGKVTLVSEPGHGSVFTMYLPKSGDC